MTTNNMERDILTQEDKKYIVEKYNEMSAYQMAVRLGIKTEGRTCPIVAKFIKDSNLQPTTGGAAPAASDVKKEEPKSEDIVQAIIEEQNIADAPVGNDKAFETVTLDEFATVLRGYNIFVRTPMSEKEKKDIQFLLNQMEAKRFILTYRTLRKAEHKQLFKEEFIRALYGKGDMPQEEVNDFIDVCMETVLQYDIGAKIREIEIEASKEGITPARKTALDTLVISYHEQRTASTKRAGEIKKTLGANREQRLKDSRPTGLTVMALIEGFQDAEKRASFIKLQQAKDKELTDTMVALDAMEETKALILGISAEELIQGNL